MFKKITVLLVVSCLSAACSGTLKSPVSGKKYNVNVGCYQDKESYDQAREEAMRKSDPDPNIVDCSDVSREASPY